MGYKNFVECFKDIDLSRVGYYYYVEENEKYEDGFYSEYEIEEYGISEFVDWSAYDYNPYDLEEMVGELIKKSNHYLVIACNHTWDGRTGYKIADSFADAISRNYDACIYPVDVTSGGKILTCVESSHDVPMGATTYIIALTNREKEMIDNNGWKTVEKILKNIK